MKRIKPCDYCKRRRRKCERPEDESSCLRCIRLDINCRYDTAISADSSNYTISSTSMTRREIEIEMAEMDGTYELQEVAQDVQVLQHELQQLQFQLDQQRLHDQSSKELTMPKHTSCMNVLPILKKWDLTVVNGHLRLETGINTLSDLLQYWLLQKSTTEHIVYLSPFSNSSPVHFRLQQTSMLSKAVRLLKKHGVFDGSFENLNNASLSTSLGVSGARWKHRHQNTIDLSSSNSLSPANYCTDLSRRPLALPATLFASTSYCPELMVDILVKQYFKCYNVPLPMLHEPTYMAQYNKSPCHARHSNTHESALPTSSPSYFAASVSSSSSTASSTTNSNFTSQHSPITLAICCYMSVSFCRHLPLTVYQKREYGEYFYLACREQIDELYDDPSPHKQLQVLISINLLVKFMGLTLKIKDGRRLVTIAYLISLELSKYATSPNTTFDIVEKGLTSRHTILATILFGLTEYVCDQRMDDIMPDKIQWDALPGESDATASMLRAFECLFGLVLHHDCIVMVHQLRRVIIGQVGEISLESVVRFDNLCIEWWKKLPDRWRYYGNPYDSSVKNVIEQCIDEQALAIHSFLLTLTLGVHSILLHPQNLQEHLSELIQKRAMMVTLNCCELLIVVADRLRKISKHCGFYCDYIIRVFDSLHSLMIYSRNSESRFNMDMITKHISRCLEELDAIVTLGYYQATHYSSPGEHPSIQNGNGDPSPSVYASYPLPGNALVFDIVSSSAKNLGVNIP